MARLTLSLPDELLAETDRLAGDLRQSRCGLVQQVLSEFLRARREHALEGELAEGYREMAAESLSLARAFAGAEQESLPAQIAGEDDDLEW